MGKAPILLLIAVGTGLCLYWLIAPHVLVADRPKAAVSAPTPAPRKTSSDASSTPVVRTPPTVPSALPFDRPVEPPRTTEQREKEDIEARRGPYYSWIKRTLGDRLDGWQPAHDDPATLELYLMRNDPRMITRLLEVAVQPYARQYGFVHVRLFLPNPPGSVDRYRLYAEANPDENGAWHAFIK
jgi:hypothetical protein